MEDLTLTYVCRFL